MIAHYALNGPPAADRTAHQLHRQRRRLRPSEDHNTAYVPVLVHSAQAVEVPQLDESWNVVSRFDSLLYLLVGHDQPPSAPPASAGEDVKPRLFQLVPVLSQEGALSERPYSLQHMN